MLNYCRQSNVPLECAYLRVEIIDSFKVTVLVLFLWLLKKNSDVIIYCRNEYNQFSRVVHPKYFSLQVPSSMVDLRRMKEITTWANVVDDTFFNMLPKMQHFYLFSPAKPWISSRCRNKSTWFLRGPAWSAKGWAKWHPGILHVSYDPLSGGLHIFKQAEALSSPV